ncbi:response regulator [Pedobacter jejuensis]|uniref:DNA-binding response regulator n=1 Tax=Pedobacter jejuensis TaxID=1268550 RepID=A0A3N0C250_9SPHI|nr:response regulator transcription factor [Pedobacter jejuensis]RNL56494.1 DNA-binding response regulator [Pedobacter jejuensis]
MLRKTRIAIVDDHPVVIEGLQKLLLIFDKFELAASFNNGYDFIKYIQKNAVELVLLDINLPDLSGIDLCKELKAIAPETIVLAFSNHTERSMVMNMIQNGASGYLLKNISSAELLNCINDALNGQIVFSEDVRAIILKPALNGNCEMPKLTKREKEILLLISDGKITLEIAKMLFLSKLTVETHRKNLLHKFKANNVAELIKIASKEGFL